jgi:hypothetical protein
MDVSAALKAKDVASLEAMVASASSKTTRRQDLIAFAIDWYCRYCLRHDSAWSIAQLHAHVAALESARSQDVRPAFVDLCRLLMEVQVPSTVQTPPFGGVWPNGDEVAVDSVDDLGRASQRVEQLLVARTRPVHRAILLNPHLTADLPPRASALMDALLHARVPADALVLAADLARVRVRAPSTKNKHHHGGPRLAALTSCELTWQAILAAVALLERQPPCDWVAHVRRCRDLFFHRARPGGKSEQRRMGLLGNAVVALASRGRLCDWTCRGPMYSAGERKKEVVDRRCAYLFQTLPT